MTLKEIWALVDHKWIRVTCTDGSVHEGNPIDVDDRFTDEDIADGDENLTLYADGHYEGIYNHDIASVEVIET